MERKKERERERERERKLGWRKVLGRWGRGGQ